MQEDFDDKYKEWIITYSHEDFENLANSLENLIETNKESYDINQAKYLYKRAMELELDFFMHIQISNLNLEYFYDIYKFYLIKLCILKLHFQ